MINIIFCLLISLISQPATVDEAIELYLMGDMNGSITALESLLALGNLSLDEEIRAYHRLGAAYFGIGEPDKTESSFYSLLQLDPYYDLGPWENPQLQRLLDNVRQESMATVLVQGEPDGALIFMNGEYVGSAPYIKDNLLSGQTYTFTIMADGYEPDVQTCTTLPGQLHTMIYQMTPVSSSTEVALLNSTDTSAIIDPVNVQFPHTVSSQGGIVESGSGTYPVSSDTAITLNSTNSETMTIEQLNSLLHGGEQMTALGDIGPLSSGLGNPEQSDSSQELIRDLTQFQNTGSTIETSSESQARMVFSDVNMNTENVLQTDPGSTYSSRTSSEVQEVLASKASAVTFIYNKHLRSDPMLSGTVLIEMIIEPSGRVSNVSILDSTTFNPAFDLELASAVETWRFGAVDEDEGPLPVTYPFNFSR